MDDMRQEYGLSNQKRARTEQSPAEQLNIRSTGNPVAPEARKPTELDANMFEDDIFEENIFDDDMFEDGMSEDCVEYKVAEAPLAAKFNRHKELGQSFIN